MQNQSPNELLKSISPCAYSPVSISHSRTHSRNSSLTQFNHQALSNSLSSSPVRLEPDANLPPTFLQKPTNVHSRSHSRNNSFINMSSRAGSPINISITEATNNSSNIIKSSIPSKNGDLPPIPNANSKDENSNRRRKLKISEFKLDANSELSQSVPILYKSNLDSRHMSLPAELKDTDHDRSYFNSILEPSRTSALTCLLM